MMKISEIRKDSSSHYQNALLLGDVAERVKVLKNCGQPSLAYLTAVTHDLKEEAENLAEYLQEENLSNITASPDAQLLVPTPPLVQSENNWPLLTVSKSLFEGAALAKNKPIATVDLTTDVLDVEPDGDWGADDLDIDDDGAAEKEEVAPGEGWDGDDLELPDLDVPGTAGEDDAYFVAPTRGVSVPQQWTNNSKLAIDHVLAGSFETAARLLQDQIGVVNIGPFKHLFLSAYSRSQLSFSALPNMPSLSAYPLRKDPKLSLPAMGVKISDLSQDKLKHCYDLTTQGKFNEALEKFRLLLLNIPLIVVESKPEIEEAKFLVAKCREYILGLQMELYRKELAKDSIEDQKRNVELAAYFTHCDLERAHLILTLRTAMNLAFKLKNYHSASSFGRRLLDLGPSMEMMKQTKKILQVCEKNPVDEHPMEYDERNPFSVCGKSYKPVYAGKPSVKCPFCGASYSPQFKEVLCGVCTVSEVNKDSMGLRISPLQFR
jgi:coatomer protein complex subunit alpha (xenin)